MIPFMTDSPIGRAAPQAGLRTVVGMTLLVACAFRADAQWLNYPTPGIPRTSDGKPNLSAPAPRSTDGKPDLSGLWKGGALPDLKEIPLRPGPRAAVE